MAVRHRVKRARLHTPKTSDSSIESLEARRLLAVNVLTYHNDTSSDGVNSNEVALTPSNVKVGSFGKLFTVSVKGQGQVYAQPLVDTNVTINSGVNTSTGAAGVHNVVYEATENDVIYAIDTGTGAVLWTRTFLDPTNPGSGTGVIGDDNNTLGASVITPVTSTDVSSTDINPNIGITGTPVIDPTTNTLYVSVKDKETINSNIYFVQRVHAINLSDGTDQVTPFLTGSTTNGNTNNTQIYAYGTGDGEVTDPYNGTGKDVVQFNALRDANRQAMSLVNGVLYETWASHGDNGPYHGWVVAWNVSKLLTSGFQLQGVLCTSPNDGESGIWGGGGRMVFEPDDSAFYFLTGNGTGGPPTLNAQGFPTDANYNEAVVKAQLDSTTTPTNQGPNGWGIKIDDYFIPYNVQALDGADSDFGSGAPVLLPPSAGIAGHPNLLVVGGKSGQLFVLDRNNLGHYNSTYDNVVNAVANTNGNLTAPYALPGLLSTPAFYNNSIYAVSGYSGAVYQYSLSSTGQLVATSQTSQSAFGYLPGSPSISSNGINNGIVWIMDDNLDEIHAFSASSLSDELWNSAQNTSGADAVGAVVKFATPTIANGEVFVGTSDALVVYGLTPPANAVPSTPALTATTLSATSINLTWTDSTVAPNLASSYLIEESTNDSTFTQITSAPAGSTAVAIGGLSPQTTYYFRIRSDNSLGDSGYSNVVNATTGSQTTALNFATGFSGASGSIATNGSAAINGSNLEITNGGLTEAGSAFADTAVNVASFNTQFSFQLTAGAATADGFTFTLQNVGTNALGPTSGGLGYGPAAAGGTGGINNSVAIKFDLYNNAGEGSDSTGLYTDGASPTAAGSIDLTTMGLNLHSGDPFLVSMSYDGTTLSVTLEDTQTGTSATQNYAVNIPSVIGASTAYAGFTGGTGGEGVTTNILNWTYSNSTTASSSPNTPTGLGATAATATSVNLNWTNTSSNETGFYLDRATDSGFTQNLITETLPTAETSYTDSATGLAPGSTFYYRLRAFNSAGASGNSNTAVVAIPIAPAKPTNQVITGVSSTEIDMSWQDNAGHAASAYDILEAVNQGSFSVIAALPPTSRTAPSTYDWSATGLTPGNYYEFHIEAVNSSGHNDFAGVNATTLSLAPTGVTAVQGGTGVNLSWSAVTAFGGVTYNIYRGTTPGGEGTTPLYTGITAANYLDTAALAGTTYYYKVTAVNTNNSYTPPLPSESAQSAEASTAGGSTSAPSQLTGTSSANTTSSYDGKSTDTYTAVFDGNTGTYWDAPTANGNYVQLNLGAADTISSIAYAPRATYEYRMVGGVFEVSNDPNFVTGVVTLFTVTAQPGDGLTTQAVSPGGTYQYIRYVSPAGSFGNIAEMQVFGTASAKPGQLVPTSTSASTTSSYDGKSTDTYTAVFDGNTGTYWDAPTASGNWVQANLGAADNITSVVYSPRAMYESRMVGGVFEASNDATFSTGVVTLFTVAAQPGDGLTTQTVSPGGAYQYVRYNSPAGSYGNISEMQIIGTAGTGGSGTGSTPTVTAGPTATLSANGLTAALSITASESGNPTLNYTWASTSLPDGESATPTFSTNNGSSSGNSVVASFSDDGTYGFEVTITDPSKNTIVVPLSVNVIPVLTEINITPGAVPVQVPAGGNVTFVADAEDQFEDDLDDQPTFVWSIVSGGAGSINSSTGVYTASTTVGSTATVTASAVGTAGTVVGSHTVKAVAAAAPSAPSTPTLTSLSSSTVAIAWTASTSSGVTGYDVLRNGSQIGTTGSTTLVYTDNTANAMTTYSYTVEAVANSATSSPSGPLSVTTPAASSSPLQLTGTSSANTTSSYDGKSSDSYTAVFDGNTGTFFDSPSANGNYVQLNLGAQDTISSIAYAPRATYEFRMVGGVFEASNDPNFVTGVVTLFTVTAQPGDALTTQAVSPGGTYQYIRYIAPAGSYGNIAEMQVFGTATTSGSGTGGTGGTGSGSTVQLTGTASADTSSTYNNDGDSYTNVFDGNTNTFWDASAATGNWVDLDLGSPQNITKIAYAPRIGFEYRMIGGMFEASNDSTFATGVVTLYTVTAQPADGVTTQAVSPGGDYRYVRYFSPAGSYGNMAEMQVFGIPPTQLTGTATASTTSTYANDGDTYANVFDGNTSTFWDSANANSNYVQLNLGAAHTITSIAYAPRMGYEYRMMGGVFEASNDPNFISGVTVLDTITAAPGDGLTTQSVSVTGTYQYVRYVAADGTYGNIAEMQVFGY